MQHTSKLVLAAFTALSLLAASGSSALAAGDGYCGTPYPGQILDLLKGKKPPPPPIDRLVLVNVAQLPAVQIPVVVARP